MTDLERIPVTSPASIAVFTRILTHGPIGRSDVAKRTGFSHAAVTKAVTPLVESGYVVEAQLDRTDLRKGRPIAPLVVAGARAHLVGVKVTAHEVFAVLTDLAARPLAAASRRIPSSELDPVLSAISDLVAQLRPSAPGGVIDGVGVSVSGDVDLRSGIVRHSPLMGWADVHLRDRLEPLIKAPVTIENDVRALTVSEQLFGRGADAESFAVVTIGEGIGCGIFVNGEVIEGSHGVSGEIGHLPLASGDLTCSCGRRGCVETVASSRAILSRLREQTGQANLTMDDAVELAHAGEAAARDAFGDAGDVLGAALAALVNLVGPDVVIIAGEGVAEYDLYAERMRRTFLEHAFGSAVECEIVLQSHTFDDWARGAAVAVIREIARGDRRLSGA